MTSRHGSSDGSDDRALLALFGAIAARDHTETARRLRHSPLLATRPMVVAAAAFQQGLAERLVVKGADVRARNRRGAEPLHYAADGGPDTGHWDPVVQRELIAYPISAGADPNALDKSGLAPLHRAVRNRCSAAAGALIDNGADPRLTNSSGSTPLHLAVQNTGKSDSGSEACKREQRRLVVLLVGHGANPTDVDNHGKSVAAAASSDWIRQLLGTPDEGVSDRGLLLVCSTH